MRSWVWVGPSAAWPFLSGLQFPSRRNTPHLGCLSALLDITAAALATGACIVGILCLPLILLLVYKQRQVVSNRREYPCPPGMGVGCA